MKNLNEIKRMQQLAGINEIKMSDPTPFEVVLERIPNNKYFYILDNIGNIDEYDNSDLVDYFYDDIFNNELKNNSNALGDNFNEFQIIDRAQNPTGYGTGKLEDMLYDKIHNIILDYKNR
jgi:hypothetical protein